MKLKTPKKNEFTDALDEGYEEPAKINLKDSDPTVQVVKKETNSSLSFEVSVFSWSDGKYGATVKAKGDQLPGESPDQLADRINRFGVAKLREVETLMDQIKKGRK
jgi:hypothetical protein